MNIKDQFMMVVEEAIDEHKLWAEGLEPAKKVKVKMSPEKYRELRLNTSLREDPEYFDKKFMGVQIEVCYEMNPDTLIAELI